MVAVVVMVGLWLWLKLAVPSLMPSSAHMSWNVPNSRRSSLKEILFEKPSTKWFLPKVAVTQKSLGWGVRIEKSSNSLQITWTLSKDIVYFPPLWTWPVVLPLWCWFMLPLIQIPVLSYYPKGVIEQQVIHSQCSGRGENQFLWGFTYRLSLHVFKIYHTRHHDPYLYPCEPIDATAQWAWHFNQGRLLGNQASERLNDLSVVCDLKLCVLSPNAVLGYYTTCLIIFPDILLF